MSLYRTIKSIFIPVLCLLSLIGCNKDDKEFTLKTIKLNTLADRHFPDRRLYFQVVRTDDRETILAKTDSFSSQSTLPLVLSVSPALSSKLYHTAYNIELVGDSTGVMSSSEIEMGQYKIIFPLEMEVENHIMNVALSGSWK